MMQLETDPVVLLLRRNRLVVLIAQRKNRAAGVRQYAVDRAIVGQSMQGGTMSGSQNHEAGTEFCRSRKNLDHRMSVGNAGLHLDATRVGCGNLRRKNAQFVHRRGIQSGRPAITLHLVNRRQYVQQNQFCFLLGGDLASKR